MTRMRAALTALAVAALVSGCSAAAEPSAERVAPAVAETAEATPSAEPTSAPVTIEPTATPTAEPLGEYGNYTQDEFYLLTLKAIRGVRPDDAALIGAGHLVCEQLAAGTPQEDIRVVTGEDEDADWNNDILVTYGIQVYCPIPG